MTRPDYGRAAAVALLPLNAYLQAVEWINLFPWNDIRQGNGQKNLDLILAGVMMTLTAMLWLAWRAAALASVIAPFGWAWLQIQSWWLPYIYGASPSWQQTYERWFGQTVSWLPRTGEHLPPDANHLVLQTLIILSLAASLLALLMPPTNDSPPRPPPA